MKTKTYIRFISLAQTGSYRSYEHICRALHVCPDDLDEYLMKELGYTGTQLVDYFGKERDFY